MFVTMTSDFLEKYDQSTDGIFYVVKHLSEDISCLSLPFYPWNVQ